MQVVVQQRDEVRELTVDGPLSVADVLDRLKVHPSTVLVVVEETIIPDTATISADIALELVDVASGG